MTLSSLLRSPLASRFCSALLLCGSLAWLTSCGVDSTPAETTVTAATSTEPSPEGTRYELHLHHLHTGENLDIVYRVGDRYLPEAVDELNHFLRDHRTQDVHSYDPREFDALHALLARLKRPDATIDIVCGYRTPWSNQYLRTRGGRVAPRLTGVAEHSQHMLAKAIDIRVPGVSTLALRNAALSLHAGGVGYYPSSQFVHVDVGPVREWTFGRRHHEG
ncbi:MAG: DUF882 domain-containing protein [Acidobacteriaceae bacterium]|nr:DUF882 domain-containing protein [Acidobacteriaceae bacterium]